MTVSKERRESLREGVETAESHGFTVPVHPDELRALLDMADERDRYRALLIVAASVLSEDGDMTEADAHALYRRIDKALESRGEAYTQVHCSECKYAAAVTTETTDDGWRCPECGCCLNTDAALEGEE